MLSARTPQGSIGALVVTAVAVAGLIAFRVNLAERRASDPAVVHGLTRQLCHEYRHVWTSQKCITNSEKTAADNARDARHLPEIERLKIWGWDPFYHQFSAPNTIGLFAKSFTDSDYDQLVGCYEGCVAIHVRTDRFTSCMNGLRAFGKFHGQWDEVVGTGRGSIPSLPADSEATLIMRSSKPMPGSPWIDLTKIACSSEATT